MTEYRYRDLVDYLDVDAFEEAIGFEPKYHKDDNDVGQCPDLWGLHKNGDSTGKFAIHRRKKLYNCWVCGGGSLLSLAMAFNDHSEGEAIEWLGNFAGEDEQDEESFLSEIDELLNEDERRRDPIMPWFNERVIEPWTHNVGLIADWFNLKGIDSGTARSYKIGFDPEHKRLTKKGEYVGPAIIFPHYWNGRLVGWQERWLDDDRPKWVPKYTNTQDFPRFHTIFNYEKVYYSQDPILVVESVPTVLYLDSLEVNAVGTFGSNVTPEQTRLLRLCQQGVILCPDNDAPGRKFAYSLGEYLENYIPVSVANPVGEFGSGADLADVDPTTVLDRVESAKEFDAEVHKV